MRRLILTLILVCGYCAPRAYADAKDDFDAIFGETARKVQATKEPADDVKFARTVLERAEKLRDDPAGQVFFYTKAYEFALADPTGFNIAREAMLQLAEKQPKLKPYTNEKLLGLDQRRYEGAAKNRFPQQPFADSYVDRLLEVAEYRLQQGDVQKAAALSTTAGDVVKLHSPSRRRQAQALAGRIKERMEVVAKLDKLREQLQRQPQDQAVRRQLVTMIIVEFDAKDAATYLEAQPEQKDSKVMKLALEDPAELGEEGALALAEWYKAQAPRASTFARVSVVRRAIACYERYLKLHHARDTQRLKAQVALEETRKLLPREAKAPLVVNLLPLINTQRDAVRGTWIFNEGALVGDGEATLRIPYQPPEEYDFRIEFTRVNGTGSIGQMLSASGASFGWIMAANANKDCGFDEIDHKRAWENPTHVSDPNVLENGRRYTSIVRVRRNAVWVEVQGKVLARHETDYTDMSPQWRWDVGRNCLGVGTWTSKTLFHVVEIVEITGEGKPSPRQAGLEDKIPKVGDGLDAQQQ